MRSKVAQLALFCGVVTSLGVAAGGTPSVAREAVLRTSRGGAVPCYISATANCPKAVQGRCWQAPCTRPKGGTGYICTTGVDGQYYYEQNQGADTYPTCGHATSGQVNCVDDGQVICVFQSFCEGCNYTFQFGYICGSNPYPDYNQIGSKMKPDGTTCKSGPPE